MGANDDQAAARPGGKTAGDRLMGLLKTRGALTAADLGGLLGTSGEAARQLLLRLAADGLVESTAEPRGVGRPRQLWTLTRAGDARFPDAHAELMAQMLRAVRTELGEEALERLIAVREAETKVAYAAAMEGAEGLEERVARLAAIRDGEGYMATWQAEPDGGFLLVENHCPICVAATACQGFCRAELRTFGEALGPGATVARTEHIVSGARRCAYRITPA
jgi:predicted ArsR family transcriptional regulator